MKKILYLFILIATAYLSGCQLVTDDVVNPIVNTKTVLQILEGNAQFSTVVALIREVGLDTAFNKPSGVAANDSTTFFAPTNAAFSALASAGVNVSALTADQKRQILLYHKTALGRKFVTFADATNRNTLQNRNDDGSTTSATFLKMRNSLITSISDFNYDRIFITRNGTTGAITGINGNVRVSTPNIVASNGVIHAIDRVLVPTSVNNTLYALISANPNFSLLKRAIDRANTATGATILNDLTSAASNITFLAPNNAAFTAAGLDEAGIDATDPATLLSVLNYHRRTGNRSFSNNLTAGTFATTGFGLLFSIFPAFPNDVVVNLDQNTRVLGTANRSGVNDLLASNGVIHTLNKVLIGANTFTNPTQTIAQIATATSDLSLLVKALSVTGLTFTSGSIGTVAPTGTPNAPNAVNSPYTVFAPTNAAFVAAGYANEAAFDALDAAGKAKLTKILRYHVLNASGRTFSPNFSNGRSNTMLWNGTAFLAAAGTANPNGTPNQTNSPTVQTLSQLTISVSGGVFTVKGDANATPVAVDATLRNILASDGIIHVVNTVLLPTGI